MPKAIAVELKGNTAFFKKPDVNANVYFTYSHIHKVALLGIFGAILGLKGYHSQNRDRRENGEHQGNQFPEFYQKLHHLKVSIVPHGDRGYFPKKIQVFNNSVGYASLEEGNNLIVKEQWLEKPHWSLYLLDDNSTAFQLLKEALLQRKSVYLPYLGKNDHPAGLYNAREVQLMELEESETIDSLFIHSRVEFQPGRVFRLPYFYQEFLPVGLNESLNSYIFEEMVYTNRKIKHILNKGELYSGEEQNLFFF